MIKTPVYLFEDAIDNLHVYRVMDAHDDIVFNGLLGRYHPAEMLIKERDRIAHIAKCINEHASLVAQVEKYKTALEDFASEDCCLTLYPQQFNDGRCRHCIATDALKEKP
jgi:hypothetical protein